MIMLHAAMLSSYRQDPTTVLYWQNLHFVNANSKQKDVCLEELRG